MCCRQQANARPLQSPQLAQSPQTSRITARDAMYHVLYPVPLTPSCTRYVRRPLALALPNSHTLACFVPLAGNNSRLIFLHHGLAAHTLLSRLECIPQAFQAPNLHAIEAISPPQPRHLSPPYPTLYRCQLGFPDILRRTADYGFVSSSAEPVRQDDEPSFTTDGHDPGGGGGREGGLDAVREDRRRDIVSYLRVL